MGFDFGSVVVDSGSVGGKSGSVGDTRGSRPFILSLRIRLWEVRVAPMCSLSFHG
jgi:hypothetical protein